VVIIFVMCALNHGNLIMMIILDAHYIEKTRRNKKKLKENKLN
jgi:uncharacterized integral membrane protein